MTQKKLLIVFFVLSAYCSFSQNFSKFSVDKFLIKNANAIVNYDDFSIKLIRQNKMLIHHKTSISILNKRADHYANLTLHYDKQNTIKNVYMEFYDAMGNRIKKVKKSDFDDYSATEGFSLYSEDRVIHYKHTATSYPYTVNYEYELEKENTAFIPGWMAVNNYNVGVKSSTYSFSYPTDFKIQKLESNFEGYEVKKKEAIGLLQYEISNLAPIKYEDLSPYFYRLIPRVKLASNKFHLAGKDGVADNWVDMGKWMYHELLASRNNLSPETVAKVKEMVKDVDDPIKRAKIIYEYVQNKTRYISVQIGIGGWQPMFTDDVDRLGYGDCKALTFYTKSLMDIAKVPSFYTLVNSDYSKTDIEKETVTQQGNHAFLCLPREKDSIWLECTSQKVPFGYINEATDDRNVLVIAPEGGKIVHTNTNKPEENLQEIVASYSLNEAGIIQGNARINSFGTQYKKHLGLFDALSPDDLEKSMKNHFDFLNNLSFSKIEAINNKKEKKYQENIEFTAENYGIINTNASLIFTLNALNRNSYVPDRERNRKTPFEILRGFKHEETYNINIPESYKLTELPETVKIENQFGTYNMSIEKLSDTSLQYKRDLLVNKGLYSKDLYEDYRSFRKRIRKLESIKIIITKK